MIFKRIIYALLYSRGDFFLSRNFRLQKVGDVKWLKNNFGFGETCNSIDELIIILVSKNPDKREISNYFDDVNNLREKIFVPITLGGGIRNSLDAKSCFENGADKILINKIAQSDLSECKKISQIFGKQALSIMVDYKKINQTNYTFLDAGAKKSISLSDYFEKIKKIEFGELILNSIDKDGTAAGFDYESISLIPKNFKNPILMMGGAGKPEHFTKVLSSKKISGAITANLFNFLGSGLMKARDYSLKKEIELNKFEGINI